MTGRARLALVLTVLVVLAAVPAVVGAYKITLASQVLIFALLAMSIDILAGYAGRTPLCFGAIFGVATYVVLYYATVSEGSLWLGVILGIAAATATAALFAVLAIRTSGVYFLLLSLALGMIVWGICNRWTSVTGGENGIRGAIRPAWLTSPTHFYYFALAVFVVAAYLMWRFVNSPFGLTLKGIRESETRMRALGYHVPLHLFIGFTVAGLFAGVAGVLYAFFNSFVSPTTVGLGQSVAALLMVIVGGTGTLFGGLIGATLVIAIQDIVSVYTDRWSMLLGLIFIGTMIFAPDGVLGKLAIVFKRRRRVPAAAETAPGLHRS